MGAKYRLFGSETSPYSIKVRSYLRYKKLPFDWIAKGFGTEEEFQSLAKSQALPMLVSPKGGIAHDSTSILSQIEPRTKKYSATPDDKACRALALLLEEYADEWLNKAMFHYRWGTSKAAKTAAARQAEHIFAGFTVEGIADIEKSIAKSMTGRLKLVGSTKKTGPVLEGSFTRFLTLLNAHLEKHLFLFGGHPSFADFAIAGQLIQLMKDEVSGNLIRETAPFVTAWCEFMEEPRQGAPFESFEAVSDTLLALIKDEVAPTYIAWAEANAESLAKKRKTVTVSIDGTDFKQGVQTHTLSSYEAVNAAFAETPATPELEAFLKDAGLGDILTLGEPEPVAEPEPEAPAEEPAAETKVVPDTPEAEKVPAAAEAEAEAEAPSEPEAPAEPEASAEDDAPETDEDPEKTE